MKSIPYGRQSISENDIASVVKALKSDYLTTGPTVNIFEENFAKYIGAKYAVAVSNGTAALHLSAMALGVNQNTNVITTPITFSASANCIRYCGGNIYFADIDPNTVTLDINKVEELILSKPKGFFSGIIPVDLAGYPVNLEAFRILADKYNLWVLEDSCHAPGGWFLDSDGTKQHCGNGNYADFAIFSFHPVKHIACGEGGMITTNDHQKYLKLKQLRSHGMVYQGDDRLQENHGGWYMELQELGYNYRIPDILCALGISQLEKANEGIIRRREIAKKYDVAFQTKITTRSICNDHIGHAYHLYIIEVEDRKALYDYLRTEGIFTQVHYIPLHLMPYYKELGFNKGDFPYSETYYNRCLSLPMYPTLSEEEQDFVIEKVLSHEEPNREI